MLPARNMIIFRVSHAIDTLMIDEQAGADDIIAAAAFCWLKCQSVGVEEVASGDDTSTEHE